MAKRLAEETDISVGSEDLASHAMSSQTGAAQMGEAARPSKVMKADGTTDMSADMKLLQGDDYVITFNGTTWLDNNTNFTTGSAPDPNMWCSFPWEFINWWISEPQAREIINKYKFWKPKSCQVSFSDAQMYTQINTGSTPFMMPSMNQKIYGMLDTNYSAGTTSQPFGLGESGTTITPTASTGDAMVSLLGSFRKNGYTDTLTPVIVPLPNNFRYGSSNVLTDNDDFTYDTMNGIQQPGTKSFRPGSGHSMTFNWKYKNQYMRLTSELMVEPTKTYLMTQAGAAENKVSITSPRADELFGTLARIPIGPKDQATRPTNQGACDSVAFMVPATTVPQNSGNVDNPTGANPWQTGAETLFPNPLRLDIDRVWPIDRGSPVNPIVDGVAVFPHCGSAFPQPKLMLHLQSDQGVLGTAGTSQCQIDFKISYVIRCFGKQSQEGRYFIGAGFDFWQQRPVNPPRRFFPYFQPIAFIEQDLDAVSVTRGDTKMDEQTGSDSDKQDKGCKKSVKW